MNESHPQGSASIIGMAVLALILLYAVISLGLGIQNWAHGDGFVTTRDVQEERKRAEDMDEVVRLAGHAFTGIKPAAAPIPAVPQ